MIREVRVKCPELKQTIVLEDEWADLKHDAQRVSEEALHEIERSLQFDDPINIQYTSGTTGFPKGATLSHHNILNNGYFIGEFCGYTEKDRVCIPVPLYHCFGMVLGNLAITTHGAAMVFPGESFDPLQAMKTRAAGEVHGALRRADDVHRRARAPGVQLVRLLVAPHRDHGRLARARSR